MNTSITYKEYQEALATCRNYLQQQIENYNTLTEKDSLLEDCNMSVRLYNSLSYVVRDIYKKGDKRNCTLKYIADNLPINLWVL